MNYETLQKAISEIDALLREAESAEHMPRHREMVIDALEVHGNPYGPRSVSDETKARGRKALKREAAIARAEGEAERDQIKAKCAARLSALRDALPSMIGPAVIDLGCIARAIHQE